MYEKIANLSLKLQKWRRFLFILQNRQFADKRYCSLAIDMLTYTCSKIGN